MEEEDNINLTQEDNDESLWDSIVDTFEDIIDWFVDLFDGDDEEEENAMIEQNDCGYDDYCDSQINEESNTSAGEILGDLAEVGGHVGELVGNIFELSDENTRSEAISDIIENVVDIGEDVAEFFSDAFGEGDVD